MLARFLTTWQGVRTSLWALPLLMILCAVATAIAVLMFPLFPGADPVWWLYGGSAKQAPDFLSDLVGAMITMGTLVISITMVVLTLAAQQLGPRLIHSFMADRRTQIAIGLFVSTIVYLLLILRSVYGVGDDVPNLAVTIGTVLVLLSVIALPLFVHHLARAIVADGVIWRVGQALDAAAGSLLPDQPGVEARADLALAAGGASIRLPRGGYIQTIDYQRLVAYAEKRSTVIALDVRAGHHIIAGVIVGTIHPPVEDLSEAESEVGASVLVGSERTPVQDIEYPLRQLVEVALRALSPGINDPHTALVVIDRIALSLTHIMQRRLGQHVCRDGNGAVRVIGPGPTFAGIVDAAFNEIRQSGSTQPAVLIRLAAKLSQLIEQAPAMHREALTTHLALVLDVGRRHIEIPYDLKALEERVGRGTAHPVASGLNSRHAGEPDR